MKKITAILSLALLMVSCYKDQGNYDYTLGSMNEILSVTFSPSVVKTAEGEVIEVQQALDEKSSSRRIEATVEQTISTSLDDLEFYWCRTYTNEQGKGVKDTIRTKGYLEFDLPVGKAMSYNIFLQVYDTSTELSYYAQFTIKTRPLFKNSLFVLHGNEGARKLGNIEVIGSETKFYADVKAVTKDNNHYENATGIGYTTYLNIPEDRSNSNIAVTNALTIYADYGESRAYNPHGMNVRYTAQQIFKPESGNFAYRKTIQTGDPSNYTQYKVVLTETGEAYTGNYVHALYKPGFACEGNTDLPHQTDYTITAATITHNRFLLWDAKNGRFLYAAKDDPGFAVDEGSSIKSSYNSSSPLLDAHVDFLGLQKSPAEMTAVMGYINYRDNYSQQNPYFIFKDESTGEYYRYELLMLDIGDGSKANQRRGIDGEEEKLAAYTIISEKKLTGLTPTDMSTITYNSWFTTANLFFAEGGTVYRYNVSNGDKYIVYEAPEGYEVTKIKFRTEESSPFSDDLGLYLNIVMYNGTHGAIGEIKLTTAADVDTDYPSLFYDKDNNGNHLWGEIKDIQFVYDYIYKMIY
ncbi:MAG: hypothetical protein IKT86_02790 [Bacteroidaceae bacterium]|nr:hypothetical protein [Bacteroidaceae bacterium]